MDYETIKFIGFLNELAADSEYEFTPFSKVKDEAELFMMIRFVYYGVIQ